MRQIDRPPALAPASKARRLWLVGAGLILTGGTPAWAQPAVPAELGAVLTDARLQGSGLLRFLGFKIYDIRLWSSARTVGSDWAGVPLALEIEYARDLNGAQIAERSITEMRRQAELAAETSARWLLDLKRLVPDVRSGDRITALHLPGQGARFYVNGTLKGEVREAEFARLFFGIWLSPRTSEPALREALLGAVRTNP